mmetsp:Transcript_22030/g.39493  ORF Transcript_22030/g.39493 Transcript_22030/m.39493 type:complete len:241 (+) Transcript_22030:510-1232(+)
MRCPSWMSLCWSTEFAEDCLSLLLLAAGDQSCVLWLRKNDLGVWARLFDDLASTSKGATSSIAGDPVVQFLALEVLQNFWPCGLRVESRIGFVLELPGQQPAVLFSELLCFQHHACASQRSWCDNHLCPKHPHYLASLHREGGCHARNKFVTSLSADHGKSNACVSAGGLHNSASRLELTALLCILNDSEGQTVLDRAQGVEVLDLHVEVDACRSKSVDLHHGCVSNCFGDVVEDGTASC